MKFITPLVISFSLLAFAAHAADDAKNKQTQSKPSMSQGAKSSGSASAGASGSKSAGASSAFERADTNKDGRLSRAEFDAAMKKGGSGASTGKSSPAKPSSGASASGGASTSKQPSKTSK
jgi:hypothetical protein